MELAYACLLKVMLNRLFEKFTDMAKNVTTNKRLCSQKIYKLTYFYV